MKPIAILASALCLLGGTGHAALAGAVDELELNYKTQARPGERLTSFSLEFEGSSDGSSLDEVNPLNNAGFEFVIGLSPGVSDFGFGFLGSPGQSTSVVRDALTLPLPVETFITITLIRGSIDPYDSVSLTGQATDGPVEFELVSSEIPLPPALPLFAAAAVGFSALKRRRRDAAA